MYWHCMINLMLARLWPHQETVAEAFHISAEKENSREEEEAAQPFRARPQCKIKELVHIARDLLSTKASSANGSVNVISSHVTWVRFSLRTVFIDNFLCL